VEPWRYAYQHFRLHNGDRWDEDLSFQRRIMECYADPAIRKIACQCSAQSTKTVLMYGCLGYAFLEDPGPMLWVTKSKPEAENMAEGYLWPFWENTPRLAERLPTNRQKKRKLYLYFNGAYFRIAGADTKAALQSMPYRYLFLDEIRQWKPGTLEMVGKRTRSFPDNFKQFMISCPDMEGDAMDRAFQYGTMERWHFRCPKCEHLQELRWGEKGKTGGVKWETNDVTCPGGRWNEEEACKTLHYECENPACLHQFRDIRPRGADRRYFCREGQWVIGNELAPSDYVSFTWNALLPHFTSWHDQLKEFLRAIEALKCGDHMPLKDHWNETRGQPWADRMRFAKEDDYLKDREEDYRVGDPWDEEVRRFMTIDVQGKGGRHYYVVIRAWGRNGRSRKIHHEKVYTREDLIRLQQQFGVHPTCVGVDSAYSTAEIYQLVMESGGQWKALRGEEKQFFTQDQGRKAIWTISKFDPALGTKMQGRVQEVPLWLFSAPATRERLVMMTYGELGDWRLPLNEDEEYKRQVTAWERRYITEGRNTGSYEWYRKRLNDHYEACERMSIGMAAMAGLLESGQGTLAL
jgi:hypothetical protein